jgi:acyl-CoA-binding protein
MAIGEQMQRSLNRMWINYQQALRLYADFQQGKKDSIGDIAKDKRRPTETEKVDGAVRWAGTAIAKGIIDDQKFAERKVAMSSQVVTVDLLQAILANLEDMNQKMDQLLSDHGIDANHRLDG